MAAWGPVAEILMAWAVWASGALKALRWFEEVANTENGIQIGTVYSVLVTGGVHRQCLQWGLAQAFESLVETKETSCEKDVASQSLPFGKEPCNNSFKTTVWGKMRPPEPRGELQEGQEWSSMRRGGKPLLENACYVRCCFSQEIKGIYGGTGPPVSSTSVGAERGRPGGKPQSWAEFGLGHPGSVGSGPPPHFQVEQQKSWLQFQWVNQRKYSHSLYVMIL